MLNKTMGTVNLIDERTSLSNFISDTSFQLVKNARKRQSKRAESAHQPTRRRERRVQRFKSPGSAQCFLSAHGALYNTFTIERHLIWRKFLKSLRTVAMNAWHSATAAQVSIAGYATRLPTCMDNVTMPYRVGRDSSAACAMSAMVVRA